MNIARTIMLALSLCGAAGIAAGASAPVYKWVDSNGVTHYGSQPPSGSSYQSTGIRAKRTNQQALQARVTEKADLRAAQKVREDHEKDEAAKQQQEQKDVAAERSANCEKAREQLTAYDTAPRLYRPLPNGEREYLSDEDLDAERARARNQVREWCD